MVDNMTERKEALQALLAKVEAGDDAGFRSANRTVFSTPCQCMELQMREENCRHAYKGSLDAAKALHEAVLGDGYVGAGFNYTIYGSGKVSVWNIITDVSGRGEVNGRDLHTVSPARAWLIAILKALIAQHKAAS